MPAHIHANLLEPFAVEDREQDGLPTVGLGFARKAADLQEFLSDPGQDLPVATAFEGTGNVIAQPTAYVTGPERGDEEEYPRGECGPRPRDRGAEQLLSGAGCGSFGGIQCFAQAGPLRRESRQGVLTFRHPE